MNRLSNGQRTAVVNCLIEGCSIRSTVRMTGVAKKTVMRLLVECGTFCSEYQDRVFRNLKCQRLQVDEMWSFVYAKEKNVTETIAATNPAAGDAWFLVAIDADKKLVTSWYIGQRGTASARDFIEDLAGRLANRVQLTTDGLKLYLKAIYKAFGNEID